MTSEASQFLIDVAEINATHLALSALNQHFDVSNQGFHRCLLHSAPLALSHSAPLALSRYRRLPLFSLSAKSNRIQRTTGVLACAIPIDRVCR